MTTHNILFMQNWRIIITKHSSLTISLSTGHHSLLNIFASLLKCTHPGTKCKGEKMLLIMPDPGSIFFPLRVAPLPMDYCTREINSFEKGRKKLSVKSSFSLRDIYSS